MHTEGHDSAVDRRGVLRRIAGVIGGAIAGGFIARPPDAEAASGTMIYGNGGIGNDAGGSYTTLRSTNSSYTFNVLNGSGGDGLLAQSSTGRPLFLRQNSTSATTDGLRIEKSGSGGTGISLSSAGNGNGIAVTRTNWAVAGAAVEAVQKLSGAVYRGISSAPGNAEPLFEATHHGVGRGATISLVNSGSTSSAVRAETQGSGVAVHGISAKGRGGSFQGKVASVRLVPSADTTHPTSGAAGDLFVDSSERLWFCKGGTTWVQLA